MKRNSKKVQLPQNYASKLLDCEIQYRLNPNVSEQSLKQLTELYAIGFEYYESIRSHKYFYFAQKMKEVFKFIDNQSYKTQQKQKNSQKQNYIGTQEFKVKKNQFDQQFSHSINSEVCIDSVKKIIDKAKLCGYQVKKMAEIELQKQKCNLKQKIQRRKQKANFRKSFSTASGFTQELSSQSSLDLESSPIIEKFCQKQFYFTDIINENQGDENQQQVITMLNQQQQKSNNDFFP